MQLHTLDQLQARLEAMLDLIQRLKDENAQLLDKNHQLEAQLQDMRDKAEQFPYAQERLEALERENGELRSKQDDIKTRVESMLSRLETVQ
jgi:FtsZ-binding cell division protein ZapB